MFLKNSIQGVFQINRLLLKYFIILLFSIFLSMGSTGCEYYSLQDDSDSEVIETSEERGNSIGNIARGGIAAAQDDWVYVFGYGTNQSINKLQILADGSFSEPVTLKRLDNTIGECVYLNVLDGKLYFNQQGIYMMRTDGTELSRLSPDGETRATSINVIGEWIYYYSYNEDHSLNGLYKMHIDGTNRELISNDRMRDIIVHENWIYYIQTRYEDEGITEYPTILEGCYIYKMRTDGTDITQLFEDTKFNFNLILDNDYLYFLNSIDGRGYKVIKMSLDGTNRKEIGESDGLFLNVSGGSIYYIRYIVESDYPDGSNPIFQTLIYEMNTEGHNSRLIMDKWSEFAPNFGPPYGPSVAGGYIFYLSEFESSSSPYPDSRISAARLSSTPGPEGAALIDDELERPLGPSCYAPFEKVAIVTVPQDTRLNLRSGPGTNTDIISKLNRGAILIVLDMETLQAGETWVEVNVFDGGAYGWVSDEYISLLEGDLLVEVIVSVPEDTHLNLRSGPGTNYDVIGKLYGGDMLIAWNMKTLQTDEVWLEVTAYNSGATGWALIDHLQLVND